MTGTITIDQNVPESNDKEEMIPHSSDMEPHHKFSGWEESYPSTRDSKPHQQYSSQY